ncbi:MAG: hypothetical protein ACN4F8_17460 [Hydrogenophaga sp.]
MPAQGWRLGGRSLPTRGQSMGLVVRVVYRVVRMVAAQKAIHCCNFFVLVAMRMPV